MIVKEIRLKRLMPTEDGKYFGLTVDHAMGRGVMKGLDTSSTMTLYKKRHK